MPSTTCSRRTFRGTGLLPSKNCLTRRRKLSAPVLVYYGPGIPLTGENDACEYGIGSALVQGGKLIAFASQSLSESERRYAQVEHVILPVTYGLEKFHHYTLGREVLVVTDHKPLVAISKKPLCKAPNRLQTHLLIGQRYTYDLPWSTGTEITVADLLSSPFSATKRGITNPLRD